ncbi:hypothetical protein LPH50_05190 [Xylella taiwanensis]|uniref:Uncharacterized protein n=1 Tax=Xylella taiwanensis TaxID=1444770 RepID=Z9JN78_9GAMM|nr:hypothetical protein [Xylella taiwanensis]EWS79453.1 hypothetical protein AF72_00725 [Xylella taiwanensis]MCD8455372.1 hypothetical protein [Xylella taiwanensis]MCD8457776.1 hypothetical protein [Xylella taiwanensis]MCD8459911.1 hypothetical protein [Xylella taiwanensis]MCD8464027.1 hypothetical protein [Xylella taiwanensis]
MFDSCCDRGDSGTRGGLPRASSALVVGGTAAGDMMVTYAIKDPRWCSFDF